MNKTLAAAVALCCAVVVSNLSGSALASSKGVAASGTCYNGAAWTITAKRSGAQVSATFKAAPMGSAPWNMNAAWTGSNTVSNALVKPVKGVVTFTTSTISNKPTTLYVWADQSDVFTCIAAVTA